MTVNESFEVFEENLPDILEALKTDLLADLEELSKPIPTGNETYDWVAKSVYDIQVKNVSEDRVRMINQIKMYLDAKQNPTKAFGRITDADIATAKDFPIEDLYSGKLRKVGRSRCGLCPFHSERSPSFYIKDNRFNCFGCSAHGDAIEFYMRQHNATFIQAIRAIMKLK
jgi:hypothetical protein